MQGIGALVALTVFLLSVTAQASSRDDLIRAAGLSPAGKPEAAPDFQLPDVNGNLLRLRDQRGKVVFLNFWATWCPPCRHEMPTMEALYQEFRDRPFVMWAVDMQESQDQVAQFMQEQKLHFPALLDAAGAVSSQYKVRGLPTTHLIDCNGHLAASVVGPRPWYTDATRALVRALVAEPACGQASGEANSPRADR